jgi:hypothetical protein
MTDWAELRELIVHRGMGDVAAAMDGLSAAERKALVEPLRAHVKQLQGDFGILWNQRTTLAVAGAGVLSGAAAMTSWQTRFLFSAWDHENRRPIEPVPVVLQVLRDREVDWLPDLAQRLADRMRARSANPTVGRLIEELVALTGIAPPTTDGFVAHFADRRGDLDRFRAEPRWAALVPRMFEVDVAMNDMDYHPEHKAGSWPEFFPRLIEAGLLDREVVLDACLGGLHRAAPLGALRGALKAYRELAVTKEEIAAHTRDLIALLPAAHSTVAGTAQEELRALDESAPLSIEVLTEIGGAVLLRPEKKLVRAQLDWLAAVAKREPAQVDEIARTLSVAFGQSAADLQERAVKTVLKLAKQLSADTAAELAAAAALLPADLRGRVATAFGPVSPAEPAPAGPPPAPAPREMPPPIDSAEELVAEIGSLFTGILDDIDPVALERVLAGMVSIAYTDRDGLHEVLAPQAARHHWIPQHDMASMAIAADRFVNEYSEFVGILIAALQLPVAPPGAPYPPADDATREWEALVDKWFMPGPQRAITRRLHEIAVGINRAPRPILLATPTGSTGLIEPAELARRLRRAADEGWEPWPADLAQALLRLPRTPDPAAAAQAAELGTPAGALLAQRLTAGNAVDPPVTAGLLGSEQRTMFGREEIVTVHHVTATVNPCSPAVAGDPTAFAGALPRPQRWAFGYEQQARMLAAWPMMLPAHREVMAVHLVPQFFERTRSGRGDGGLLVALAEADGPVGPALGLALTYGLAARETADRNAAVDALLILAGRGELDGALFGPNFGLLVGRGELPLNRVAPALRELANAGAGPQLWAMLAAALPYTLPPAVDKPANRLADLLALGVELAGQTGDRKPMPELDSLADRKGSSQLVVQARRLREILAS